MWPPSSSPSFIGRSRLTQLPTARSPRLVFCSVTSINSVENACPSVATTVVQQPLTATLLPIFRLPPSTRASIFNRRPPGRSSMASTVPVPSTIPVNMRIQLQPDVFADTTAAAKREVRHLGELGRPEVPDRRPSVGAYDFRGNRHDELVV